MSEEEKNALKQRFRKIKDLQEKRICFSRLKGDTIGFGNFVREEGLIMDYHETVEIYKNRLKGIIL